MEPNSTCGDATCRGMEPNSTGDSTSGSPPSAHIPVSAASPTASPTAGGEEDRLLVVVTGGSKGIGRSCVESFAQRGARVLFTYCSDAASAQIVEQSFHPAGRVQSRPLDQGDFESVRAFAAEVDRWREGREISTVVNNAALGVQTVSAYGGLPSRAPSRPAAADSDESAGAADEYDAARRRADEDVALMRVNALGPLWVTEALLPMMVRPPRAAAPPKEPGGTDTSAKKGFAAGSAPSGMGEVDGGKGASMFSSSLGKKKKKTVLFIGSVGGGSQAVFPGYRPVDAMSKAAVAYASKYFASRSRQLRQQAKQAFTAAAGDPTDDGSSGASGGGVRGAAATAAEPVATVESDFDDPSGGVDFLCLCPGATLTSMFRASTLQEMEAKGPEEVERFLRALPQGRLILPEEVGEAVCWLCTSPAATMFHGAVIDASAGLAVRPGTLTEYAF